MIQATELTDLGQANAEGFEAVEYLIDNVNLGQTIDFNGTKIVFDNEVALINFKLGLVMGATIANKPANIVGKSEIKP